MKKHLIMLLVMIFSLTACQNEAAKNFVLPKSLILIKNCQTGKYAIRGPYEEMYVPRYEYASNGLFMPTAGSYYIDSSTGPMTEFLCKRYPFSKIRMESYCLHDVDYDYEPKIFDDSISAKDYAMKYLAQERDKYIEDSTERANSVINFKQRCE